MKLVLISDTHGFEPELPEGDVLIHAGDLTSMGTIKQTVNGVTWLKAESEKFQHVVLIAGNHDFFMEKQPQLTSNLMKVAGFHYLNDSEVVIDGIKFWGSPVQPPYYDWAFNCERGEEIKKHWDLIPPDTDVLITHAPPYDIMDKSIYGYERCGCEELRKAVKRVDPQIHVFGHIHEGYGHDRMYGLRTEFYNASMVNIKYVLANDPIVVEVKSINAEKET